MAKITLATFYKFKLIISEHVDTLVFIVVYCKRDSHIYEIKQTRLHVYIL